jgi:hypothetical protein
VFSLALKGVCPVGIDRGLGGILLDAAIEARDRQVVVLLLHGIETTLTLEFACECTAGHDEGEQE